MRRLFRSALRSAGAALLAAAAAVPLAAQYPYGTGTPGSGGITPRLSCNQPWTGRADFAITVDQGPGGTAALIAIGFLPFQGALGGLPLHVDPSSVAATHFVALGGAGGVPGAGSFASPLPLSAVGPSFIGVPVFAQAALVDPAGPGFGGGWSATGGLRIGIASVPQVFAACSVGGGTDPHWAVNGLSRAVDFAGGNAFTDNVDGAAYSDDGLDLYVSSGFGQLARADLRGGTPVWSWLNSGIGSTGVAWDNCWLDRERALLWMMGQPPAVGTVELIAVDVDRSSATYGQIVHNTATLSATVGLIGVFGMNNARSLAAVPGLLGGSLHLVDTDPQSPTFLQVVTSSPIPAAGGLTLNTRVRFGPDDLECYVLIQNAGSVPGELARFLVPAGIWFDHDPATPAIDNIGPAASPPVPFGSAPLGLEVSADGAIWVTGWGGAGWAGRVTLSGVTPSWTPLAATSSLGGARNAALNRDQTVLAVAVAAPTTTILFFDVATLAETGAAVLGAGVDATVLVWR